MDAPEVKRDLDRGETECIEFEKAYKGRLADIAASPDAGRTLGEAVRRYEAIEDVLGRIISYAGLLYAGNTTDPAIAKFYGDMQERITAASLHLLFFTLDLNRLDDAALDKAMADPALGHYRPWIEDDSNDVWRNLSRGLRRFSGVNWYLRLFAFPRIFYLSILTRKAIMKKASLVSLYFLAVIGASVSGNHAVAQQVLPGFPSILRFHESKPVTVNDAQFVVIAENDWRPVGKVEYPVEIQLRITNLGKKDLIFPTLGSIRLNLTTADDKKDLARGRQ